MIRVDRNLTAKLAHVANITNTLSGGMSQNTVTTEAFDDHYLVTITAPGVSLDSLKVSVDHNKILVHQMMSFEGVKEFPYLINFMMIPSEVDFEKISADYSDNSLHIVLPFNELADGYYRDIEIDH